jgi:hypothetical protein
MLPKLTFLTALVLMAAFFAAPHCGAQYPGCGHADGAACPGACVNLPPGIIGGGQYCSGVDGRSGGGGGGPAGTATPTPIASPTNTPVPTPLPTVWGIVLYTFDHGDCSGMSNAKDPINVVLVGAAWPEYINFHAAHHGDGWWSHEGSAQSFRTASGCHDMDDQVASGGNLQVPGRFHMRYYTDIDGDPAPYQPPVAVGDAHHEDIGLCPWGPLEIPKHVVDHNIDNGGVSGFDMGRNDIVANWVGNGHVQVDYVFWENIEPMRQCDNDATPLNWSWSDGWVAYISINW